jgi:hypothetical protein
MTKLSTTLKKEFFELLPPTIYFFVALHIVAFVRVLMLEKTGIAPSSSISIAVAALILSKAVLIADMVPMINRAPRKNHTWGIRHLTRPSRDVGFADRGKSVVGVRKLSSIFS